MVKGWECERIIKVIIKRIEDRKIAKIYGEDLLEIVHHAKTVILHYTLHEFIVPSDEYKPINNLIQTVCDFLQIKIHPQPTQIMSEIVEVNNEDPFGEKPMLKVSDSQAENQHRGSSNRRSRRRNQFRIERSSLTYNEDSLPKQIEKKVEASDIKLVPIEKVNSDDFSYLPLPTMVADQPRVPPASYHQIDTIDTNISIIEQYIQKMKECSENYKKKFTCPLSNKVFVHPVILLEDGAVYEEENIRNYIVLNHKSPSNGKSILFTTFQKAREIIDLMDHAKSEFLMLKSKASTKKEQTDKIIIHEKNITQIQRYNAAIDTLNLINIG